MILKGQVWKFGDQVPTHYFISGKYDAIVRKRNYSELVQHCLEDVDPTFVKRVKKGDLLVAGKGFGTGKHVWGLIGTLKAIGIGGVIAESFSSEWEKNSINSGLPSLVYDSVQPNVATGDVLELDPRAIEARNLTSGVTFKVSPTVEGVIAILEAGGLENYTLRRLNVPIQVVSSR